MGRFYIVHVLPFPTISVAMVKYQKHVRFCKYKIVFCFGSVFFRARYLQLCTLFFDGQKIFGYYGFPVYYTTCGGTIDTVTTKLKSKGISTLLLQVQFIKHQSSVHKLQRRISNVLLHQNFYFFGMVVQLFLLRYICPTDENRMTTVPKPRSW